jgi:hypothetical protein
MADPLTFGGTNDVTELDVGQAGKALHTAGDAEAYLNVYRGRQEQQRFKSEMPQQSQVFVDDGGFNGEFRTWEGTVKTKNRATLRTIESNLSRARSGQTIDANGVRSVVNRDELNETQLTDAYGQIESPKAILRDYRWGRGRTVTSGTMTIAIPLTIEFEILG